MVIAVGLGSASASATPAASSAACAPIPSTLYPSSAGSPADRYTMILRVNKLSDVDDFASADEATGGLRPRILDRDIFLINTRFAGGDAPAEQAMATKLRQEFPCNRIFALDGESYDPNSPRGYIYDLINAPEVSAVLTDWEEMDWPGPGSWIKNYSRNLKVLRARLKGIASQIRAAGGGKSLGVVPFFHKNWDHGAIARLIQRQTSRVVRGGQGFQSIQSQGYCEPQTGGPGAIVPKIRTVSHQYRRANFDKANHRAIKPKLKLGNLGFEVSFTATPDPADFLPVKSVTPSQAAACTTAILASNAGAIIYWARPSDLDALFADPNVCALRPSPSGVC